MADPEKPVKIIKKLQKTLFTWRVFVCYTTEVASHAHLLRVQNIIVFFGALGKGMGSLFREFVTGAGSFGQLSSGIPNSILSGIVYWLIAGTVMAILFVITGDRKSTRLNSSHVRTSRMPSSA